ncbi:MAG: bifunctional metallophosphatase/5'-nucleotidase [Candidatus Riflebacteria bacterium]|nr:bifunctional metallophosphatase/5'-nucleotidase [Candidatus Riflebacteria bacterium]
MNNFLKKFFSIFIILLFSSSVTAETKKILIIHESDTHGHAYASADTQASGTEKPMVGGFAALKTLIDKTKKEEVSSNTFFMLLDSGDYFQGTPLVDETTGECMIKFMNQLHFDAATIGNHEFDYGLPRLAEVLKMASFPILCCNTFKEKEGTIPDFLTPYTTFQFGKTKIALIGVTTPEIPQLTFEKNFRGWVFKDPEPILNELIPRLRKDGARFVIILSHLGLSLDRQLLGDIDADLILGGHSHRLLEKPELIGKRKIPMIHPGADLRGVSKIVLEFDDEKNDPHFSKLSYEHIPLLVASYPEDSQIKALAEEYLKDLKERLATVIGSSEVSLSRGVTGGDSPEGSFVADAMREYTGADFAFSNLGGVRFPIHPGIITYEHIFLLQPFPNTVELIEMTGKDVMDLLEKSISVPFYPMTKQEKKIAEDELKLHAEGMVRDFGGKYGYLLPSNLVVQFNPDNSPGKRIVKAVDGNGKPLDLEKKYQVAFNSFISNGGDGYNFLKDYPVRKATKFLIRDLIIRKIKDMKVIKEAPQPRLINLKLTVLPKK